MAEARDDYLTLDLALRIGELLLSSGAGAADVTATMLSVTHHLGLRNCDVDVTFTSLRIGYQASPDEPALLQMRQVRHRDIDYDDLTQVDLLVRGILEDRVDRDEARTRLAQVVSTGHKLPRWAVTLATGLAGAGIGLLLGGDEIVIGIAFLAAAGIDQLKRIMSRRRWPAFYQQVAGGLLATSFAAVTAATNLPVDPSLVVTAAVIMLLAGVGFMGAIQDALSGFYLTSAARAIEALLATAGIIAGVSGGLAVSGMVGVDIGRLEPGAAGFIDVPLTMVGGGIAAAAFALSCYAPIRSLLPIGVIAALAVGVFEAVDAQALGRAWAAGIAALLVGLVTYAVASRVRVPPLVIVVPAIVPMLPGLSIYRGLSLLSAPDGSGTAAGILAMVTAAAVAIALASGVILGEYIAQPLRREARRLEDRLSGPRLVGPVRAASLRPRPHRRG